MPETAGDQSRPGCARIPARRTGHAAWCHLGSSLTRPGLPEYSNARMAPPGGRNRRPCSLAVPATRSGTDRELRAVRLNRIVDQHVEERLVPIQLGVVRQTRARRDVRKRSLEGVKGSVRWQRRPDGRDPARLEASVALVQLDVVDDPQGGGLPEAGVGSRDVEVPDAVGRNSTSRIASSGTRTSIRSRWPSGLTNAWTVTSLGISWAAGPEGHATSSAATSATRTPGATPRRVLSNTIRPFPFPSQGVEREAG